MKTFKQLIKENQQLTEGGEMYPADDMTMKELKIACYAAEKILERLEGGASIQRWQISAIVKASEELASVYTSLSVDDDEEQASWDDEEMWDDEGEDDGSSYYDDLYYDEFGNVQSYYESKDDDDEDDEDDEDLDIWTDDKMDRIMDKSIYKFVKRQPTSFQKFESKKAKAKK